MSLVLFGVAAVLGTAGVIVAGGFVSAPSLRQVLVGVGLLVAGYLSGLAGWRVEKKRQEKWPGKI
ncbi:MAG: hypothetical protein M3277_02730 [Actinomycetota bacterium]|nr:hypothetical protein [Actinomycetota bacterium]